MKNVVEHLRTEKPEKRQEFIVDCFESCFGENMETAPEAWRGKFRKMAATPFAFYRGSAILFYADVVRDDDPFQNEKTSRVWIQGDLTQAYHRSDLTQIRSMHRPINLA